jgi:hypothetical protein
MIRSERFKLSLSELELEQLRAAVEIDGGEQAVIARELLLDWARTVIRIAREKSQTNLGVVNLDGAIKYRFAV